MRRAGAVDRNQVEVVKALRKVGASVTILAPVGNGCPDLLVGYRGQNHLLEVKDGAQPPSARKLTPAQVEWHSGWRGMARVVQSIGEALVAIGAVLGCPTCHSASLDHLDGCGCGCHQVLP